MFNGFDALELRTIDFRFLWRGARPFSQDIKIVMIDEKSISEMGRWPWTRDVHGRLARKLVDAGARVVGFDTLFTEPDLDNPQSDLALVQAAQSTDKMVSSMFFREGFVDEFFGVDPLWPIGDLVEYSFYGFVNMEPDSDGITRHVRLYAIYEDGVYPSFAVATYVRSLAKTFQEAIPELPIVLPQEDRDPRNSILVNFIDPRIKDFPEYPYVDVLKGRVELEKEFEDKIVLVGASATALFDMKAIPFLPTYEGVKLHANVIDNLINKNHLKATSVEIPLVYILILGIAFGFFLPRLGTWQKLLFFLGAMGGGVYLAHWLFAARNLVIPMVPPLFTGFGCYGGILFYHLVVEEREKRKIKGSFKQYLSPKIIDVITKDPDKLKLGGEEREVTIFFLDIAGFTTMSEALSPNQLVEVMNQCLTKFSNVIFNHDGLINKYIGDCIMAFWNAPVEQPNHATKASLAGLDCIKALGPLNENFKKQGLPSIDCRVGINTGMVVVGNMGSSERFDYTVMGDSVNLASRLEGANKEYKTHIMISEATFEAAKNDIEARDIDLIRVKGKKEPRRVFELLCRKGEMSQQLEAGRQKYHQALKLYRDKNFEEAILAFQEVYDFLPNDHLTHKYLERSRTFKISPPPTDWDGVFEMKTK
jgi:adenylate cyclase